MVTAFLGDCRMPAAVLLLAQVCKSGVALLASQSPVIDKECVQRSSKKVTCCLDARSCGIEKVGQRYLVVVSLVRKRAHSGHLGPHHSLV